MRKVICFKLLPILIILSSSPSFSEYNISPGIDIRGTYNDNIFLDSSSEEDDFITTVSPHIAFNYSSGKVLDLILFYGLNFRFYDRHSQLNDENIDEIQDISAVAHIKPSHIFFIDISDTFDRVPIDIRRKSALDNYHENITSVNEFRASPYMILPLTNTISATIGYTYANLWYDDSSSVDSDAHTAFLTLDKRFTPRINGAARYEYYSYRPDLNDEGSVEVPEYDRHEASVEIDYQITSSFKINAALGEAWFNFRTVDDERSFYWNIGADNIFKITEDTLIGVDCGVNFGDSNTAGATRSKECNLNIETGNVLNFKVDFHYREFEYLTSDRKDRLVGVALILSRPLTQKIHVSVDGKLEKDKFLPTDEDSRNYSVGSDIHYSLNRRMEIRLGYRFNRQDASSDISDDELEINDYKNNIGWLQASLTF